MSGRINKVFWILMVAAIGLTSCWKDNDDNGDTRTFKPGQGIVSYSGYQPLSSKPIKLHYYIPASGNMADMRILFVFPGTNRNADDYLVPWKSIADRKKMMVFSLEFPANTYTVAQYIEGGMFSGTTLLPESSWTFSMIEPLFEYIKSETGNTRSGYDMFGHSAGAQFVHRFMTFKPDNKVDRAVSANAGWYTVLDFNIDYPYGLKGSPATEAGLVKFFAKKFYLELGTADTDPNDPSLNTTPGAMAQGATRYARGLNYWNVALAAKGNHTFNWEKKEIQGVGHDYARMIAAAGEFL